MFILSYSDFIYEMTVLAAGCSGRNEVVRVGFSLYNAIITKSCRM